MVTKKNVDVSKLDECLGCAYTIKYNGKVISTHNDGYKTLNEAYQAGVDHVYFLTDNYDEYARASADDFEIIVQDRKGAAKKATKALVESLIKEEDESVDDYLRYEADAYYDSKYAGLEDDTKTEDFDDLKDWIWDHVANGSYVEVKDGKTGNSVRISPDEIDYEIIDDPSEWLNDELKDINPLNESCDKKEDCKGKDCKKDKNCKGKDCDKSLTESEEDNISGQVLIDSDDGTVYVEKEGDKLYAGTATNTGMIREFEVDIEDGDIDDALNRLYIMASEVYPEYGLEESCGKKKSKKCKGKDCDKDLEECDNMTFSKKEMEEACKKKSTKKCKGKKCDDLEECDSVMNEKKEEPEDVEWEDEEVFDPDFADYNPKTGRFSSYTVQHEVKKDKNKKSVKESKTEYDPDFGVEYELDADDEKIDHSEYDPNYNPGKSSLRKKMDADKQARIQRHLDKANKHMKRNGVKNEAVEDDLYWDTVVGDPSDEELMSMKDFKDLEVKNPEDYIPFDMGDEPYFDIPDDGEWSEDYTEYDSWNDEIPVESLRRRPVRESKINRKPSRSFRRPVK